jgi:phage/plasmid-associated DNA primase
VPGAVEQATRGYKEEMDVLGQFIAERCTVDESMSTQSSQFTQPGNPGVKLMAKRDDQTSGSHKGWKKGVL